MRPQERNDGAFYARQQDECKDNRERKPQCRMNPQWRVTAVALDHQDERHDDVADCKNGEVRRRIVSAVRLERQLAGRAVAAHLEEVREQAAGAAARAPAAPAAPQACPDVRAFLIHVAKMGLGSIAVVATVCPLVLRDARPDAAVRCAHGAGRAARHGVRPVR